MSGDPKFALFDFSGLSPFAKPIETLIKRVSDAIGGWYAPDQVVKLAKAEAEAAIIRASCDIQITEIQRNATYRFLAEEENYYRNMQSVTQQSFPYMKKDSRPQDVDPDWMSALFQRARHIGNEEMKQVWAKILATECNAPGAISKRTLNIVADMTKTDALQFVAMCSYTARIDGDLVLVIPELVLSDSSTVVDQSTLRHLSALGLVETNYFPGYCVRPTSDQFSVTYGTYQLEIRLPTNHSALPTGCADYTTFGKELFGICDVETSDRHFSAILAYWEKEGLKVTHTDGPTIPVA